MSWRSTSCSVLLACLLACAPAGGAGAGGPEAPPAEAAPLKISYFRAYPEPKTRKLEPTYKAVMSHSWQQLLGESPRDPLVKAAPGHLYTGFLSDAELGKYHRILRDFGIEKLIPQDTDGLNPTLLNRLALDPNKSSFTRVITVATDKGTKSYYYPDQQTDAALIQTFVKCESLVLRIVEYSFHIGVKSPQRIFPVAPK